MGLEDLLTIMECPRTGEAVQWMDIIHTRPANYCYYLGDFVGLA